MLTAGSFDLVAVETATGKPTKEYSAKCFSTRWDTNVFGAWDVAPYEDETVGHYIVNTPVNDTQVHVVNLADVSITVSIRIYSDYGVEVLPAPPSRTLQGYRQSTSFSINQYLPKA